MTVVDEEFLFQHEHWHVKKHGVECLFSGLKNVKYQKYLSRPHIGNKLQGTNVLQEREAINTLEPEWYMYQEKFKDPQAICFAESTLQLAVGSANRLHFRLIPVVSEEPPPPLSGSFSLVSGNKIKRQNA